VLDEGWGACAMAQWHNGQFKSGSCPDGLDDTSAGIGETPSVAVAMELDRIVQILSILICPALVADTHAENENPA